MSYKNFFETTNSYYDSINVSMQKKVPELNNKKNYEYVFSKTNNIQSVEVYLDDKLVLKGEYCVLGLYDIRLSVWYWSWNMAFVNKKLTDLPIKKIKNFITEIDDNYKKFNNEEVEIIHYLIANDNFYIGTNNIDKIIKLSLYLTKGIWYFPIKRGNNDIDFDNNGPNTVEYIMITKVLQY